jgi:hypothetical protein
VLGSWRAGTNRLKENAMKNRTVFGSLKKLTPVLFLSAGIWMTGCANPAGPGSSGSQGSGLVLNMTDAELVVGGAALQLTANSSATWVSSNPSIASVSAAGVVTPISRGQAVITATSGAATATCTVHSSVLLMWGSVQNAGGSFPAVWKDGALAILPGTAGQVYGAANGALRIGNDVYIGGYVKDAAGTTVTPVYWKNGVLNQLPVPSGYTYTGDWIQPFNDSSGNLYFRENLVFSSLRRQAGSAPNTSTPSPVPSTWAESSTTRRRG